MPTEKAKTHPLLATIRRLAELGFLALALGGIPSLLAPRLYPFEFLTHFRPQIALIAAGLTLLLLLFWHWRRALVAAAIGIACSVSIWPYYGPLTLPAGAETAPRIRLLWANVEHDFIDGERFGRLIAQEQPDAILLTEVSTRRLPEIEAALGAYPHRVQRLEVGIFGLLLASKRQPARAEFFAPVEPYLPLLEATLCAEAGFCIEIVSLHAPRPGTRHWTGMRDEVLGHAASRLARHGHGRILMIGDLNAAPWSPIFADILERAKLRDSALGRGVTPTWAVFLPPIAIPIDHALIGAGLAVTGRRIGPDIGSDHRPLIVDLAILPDQSARAK